MFNLDAEDDESSENFNEALIEHIDEIIERFLQGVTKGVINIDGVEFDYSIEVGEHGTDLIFGSADEA